VANQELRRTPLYEEHKALGARLVDFAGWEMPVQYGGPKGGIKAEHRAVREGAGLFDVSHMGEAVFRGPDAEAAVQRLVTRDVSRLAEGQAGYAAVCYEDGGTVDDVLVYKREGDFLVVVNAANREKDLAHFRENVGDLDVEISDESDDWALLSLQGPKAVDLLQNLTDTDLSNLKYYRFVEGEVSGAEAIISRTGYTGEDGFELYCRERDTVALWQAITAAGAKPIGLGARDSLRLEMGYALYGNEIDDTTTPLEAGLGWIVKLDKGAPFTGALALTAQKQRGITRRLVGFRLEGRGFPRHGYPVRYEGREVDLVRSGTMSPSLGLAIGTTYLPASAAKPGTRFEVDCRGEKLQAEVVKLPFWTKGSARKGR
jgi:aminomethyltransferase